MLFVAFLNVSDDSAPPPLATNNMGLSEATRLFGLPALTLSDLGIKLAGPVVAAVLPGWLVPSVTGEIWASHYDVL